MLTPSLLDELVPLFPLVVPPEDFDPLDEELVFVFAGGLTDPVDPSLRVPVAGDGISRGFVGLSAPGAC